MPDTTTPTAVDSVAGVAIHDPYYAKADDPYLPEGTLMGFTVRLGAPARPGRRKAMWEDPELSWRNYALVMADGVDPEIGTVRGWSFGIDGWVPDLSFPTAEAAVKALGKPGVVARLRKLTAEYHAAYTAVQEARLLLLRYKRASLDTAADLGGTSSYGWEADRINEDFAREWEGDRADEATVTS